MLGPRYLHSVLMHSVLRGEGITKMKEPPQGPLNSPKCLQFSDSIQSYLKINIHYEILSQHRSFAVQRSAPNR